MSKCTISRAEYAGEAHFLTTRTDNLAAIQRDAENFSLREFRDLWEPGHS
jgi:hypothetical protein